MTLQPSSMDTVAWLEHSLGLVVDRIGDPAPRVYEALFAQEPQLRAMFIGDALGSVRGEMFHRVIDTLIDVAGERPYAGGMIAAEWTNHQMTGVSAAQFQAFFDTVVQVFRQALGDDWSPQIDAAWQSTLQRVGQITAQAALQR
jgi:hemoglobin-like flavoprotein